MARASAAGKEFLAYLRGAEGAADWGLLDVANKPNRRLQRGLVGAVIRVCRDEHRPLIQTFREHDNNGLRRFGDTLDSLGQDPWNTRCARILDILKRAMGGADLTGGDQDREAAYVALCRAAVSLGST
jgi:hypothetical protein